MPNISGAQVKREIIKTKPRGGELKALISGFVRSCMALSLSGSTVMLQLDCQTEFVKQYIESVMLEVYKVRPKEKSPALLYVDCKKLLALLGIVSDGFEMAPVPDMSEDEQSGYLRGVFLGSGSFSALSEPVEHKGGGGYHLEFSAVSESFADELIALLNSRGITMHKMERNEKFVVYVKGIDGVCNCLALMKLGKLVVKLYDTAALLSLKRDVNRRTNCDVANLTRTTNAAVDVIRAIQYIADHSGLDSLSPKLVEAADARINSPEASLGALAFELGISKSGLKHRFDTIIEIAHNMRTKAQEE